MKVILLWNLVKRTTSGIKATTERARTNTDRKVALLRKLKQILNGIWKEETHLCKTKQPINRFWSSDIEILSKA